MRTNLDKALTKIDCALSCLSDTKTARVFLQYAKDYIRKEMDECEKRHEQTV